MLLDSLELPYPKARVIHRVSQAVAASEGLRWPIVVKPNTGGSGTGLRVEGYRLPDEVIADVEPL